nr:hypothetical protein [Streptomyces noursei]
MRDVERQRHRRERDDGPPVRRGRAAGATGGDDADGADDGATVDQDGEHPHDVGLDAVLGGKRGERDERQAERQESERDRC